MKIAVYDKTTSECEYLSNLLPGSIEGQSNKVTVSAFCNCFDLLSSVQSGNTYDLMLLDADGDALGGVEIAREIKRMHPGAVIVFFAHNADYAVGAYAVGALHYLLKPITKVKLGEVMERYRRFCEQVNTSVLTIRTTDGFYRVNRRDIMYIESCGHKLTVAVDGAEPICLYGKLDEYAAVVNDDRRFLRIHKSYLVNINYIFYFGSDSVSLADNTVLKISRAFSGTAKQLFCEYIQQN